MLRFQDLRITPLTSSSTHHLFPATCPHCQSPNPPPALPPSLCYCCSLLLKCSSPRCFQGCGALGLLMYQKHHPLCHFSSLVLFFSMAIITAHLLCIHFFHYLFVAVPLLECKLHESRSCIWFCTAAAEKQFKYCWILKAMPPFSQIPIKRSFAPVSHPCTCDFLLLPLLP